MFNTVITRARSLVVSVGNPFMLLKTETYMIRKYGETGRCWSEYIRLCIEHNTLDVSIEPIMFKRQKYLARLRELVCKSGLESGNSVHTQLQVKERKQPMGAYATVLSKASKLSLENTLSPHTCTQRTVPTTEYMPTRSGKK